MNKIIFVLFTCLTCLINPIYVESSSGSNFCQLDNSYALIYTCYYNYDLGAWGSFPAKADYFHDRKSLMPQQVVNLGNSTKKIWRRRSRFVKQNRLHGAKYMPPLFPEEGSSVKENAPLCHKIR